ncbi:MAG: ankyrin repeat domain-containing protein [Armatimonadetes bacterium]|nr:ankyrin repeat domain-containing protein [Armatimonadota bacterium]
MRRNNTNRWLGLSGWTLFLGSIVAVLAAPPSMAQEGQMPTTRKSTDPPIGSKGKMGQDLFLAIDHRDSKGVQALLSQGADPNSQNGLEFSPLYIAAASYQNDVVKILLDSGAKVDSETTYGTALTFACATGNLMGAKMLIERGANVNVARTDGITPLMMAANAGATPLVTELLAKKANALSKNANGSTALIYAARGGHTAIGKMLLEQGISPDRANDEGETPLMAAATGGHTEFIKLLMENGASSNATDKRGRTPLILASAYGDYPETVKELLKAGADARAKDKFGWTAANYAAARNHQGSLAALGKSAPKMAARNVKEAAAMGVQLLQSSMKTFNERTNCISCHHEGIGRMTEAMAGQKGFKTDEGLRKAVEGRLNGALNAMKPLHDAALANPEVMKQVPLIEINEVSTGYTWLLAGMADNHEPRDAAKQAMAMVLARQQLPDGHWSFSLPRIPMQSSNFTITAMAARSILAYGEDTPAVKKQIALAKDWLTKTQARTSDDRASRLMGMKWVGSSAAEMKPAADAIVADQKADGGWSQAPNLQSDAYSTGQALCALQMSGMVKTTDPIYRKGVQFLVRNQDADGSWYVAKRALPANNYFDGGFPHGESQYSSFNGSCWATMALMATLPDAKK